MNAEELGDLKRKVVRKRRNLEFTTEISTNDLLRLIELAEKAQAASSDSIRLESVRALPTYTGSSLPWERFVFRK